jgi:hypothetical protein
LSGAERLAIYNRQYWFRMFEVLQSAFPLVSRLLGFWEINEHFGRYLEAHPPTDWDIDGISDGFVAFFESSLANDAGATIDTSANRRALIEAARLDERYLRVFHAPPVTPFRPTAEDAAHLLDARLVESPAVAIFEEHSALAEARRKILADPSINRVAFPKPHPEARFVALARNGESTFEIPLDPLEARLIRLLRENTVREAMAKLEAACPPDQRAELPAKTQQWLADAVSRGFWIKPLR